MMDVVHGRRERYYYEVEENEDSKHAAFTPSAPSSWVSPVEAAEPAAPPVEREHMFDKVVTPSDVGKLNRLVIPKQHAEKYFPLDHSTEDKGLLLCFEEGGTGKPWRFRYSYWNSSQSYVMTKGWSRFVKEKLLDAGDTVSFTRGVGDSGKGRLFIDWRRRPADPPRSVMPLRSMGVPWGGRGPFAAPPATMYGGSSSGSGRQYLYFRSPGPPPQSRVQLVGGEGPTAGVPMVLDSVPVVRGKAEPKRLRLFGVNLECAVPEEDSEGSGGFPFQRVVPPPSPLQWRVAPPRVEFNSSLELDLQFKGNPEE